jgi:hypothetical protein
LFLLIAGTYNALFHMFQVHGARNTFMQRSPCPSTGRAHGSCPGWVIAYETPLCSGGSEEADNMLWQSIAEADAKARQQRHTFERGAIQNMMRGRAVPQDPEANGACPALAREFSG